MTKDEAIKNLPIWLDLAANNPIYNKYDKLCSEAYEVLDHDEYDRIYKNWASGYVACSDGYYRRR